MAESGSEPRSQASECKVAQSLEKHSVKGGGAHCSQVVIYSQAKGFCVLLDTLHRTLLCYVRSRLGLKWFHEI